MSANRLHLLWTLCLSLGLTAALGGEKTASKTIELKENASAALFVIFPAKTKAVITVASAQDTDIDLYVYDAQGKSAASDIRQDKDCRVEFAPKETHAYRVVISNLGRSANQCKLTHNGEEAVLKFVHLKPFDLKGDELRTLDLTFPGGKLAAITLTSDKDTDVDLYVFDKDNKRVIWDNRTSKDAFVSWVPAQTQKYRVEIKNLGDEVNRCTLKHTGVK